MISVANHGDSLQATAAQMLEFDSSLDANSMSDSYAFWEAVLLHGTMQIQQPVQLALL